MAYSKITKKRAGVIYGAIKRNEIVANDAFVKMLYGQAEAYINHNVIMDDIEDRLIEAIDAIFAKDLVQAQESIDAAIRVHDIHFSPKIMEASA